MESFNSGLSSDQRYQKQPKGTYPFSKNGVRYQSVNQNEPGFILSNALIPYTPIGVIETDRFPVILSTNNINSAVGYYDHINDVYVPIANDASLSYKLGFSTDFPINGQAQRNYKAETVIAFTDFNTFPKFLNCDTPVINSLDDWRLFPFASIPTITTSIIDGGILAPGAYYLFVKLIKNDGTETQYLTSSDVIVIAGTIGINTGKAIEVDLSNLDPDYNLVQVGVISKINGVIGAVTLDPVRIGTGNKASIVYTGANITTEATLEELLVEPVSYSKAKTIGQLNDAIYLGNLEREAEIILQQNVLLAKVEWVSQLISILPKDDDHASGLKRSMMHFEVYAFYVRFSKTGGAGWTKLFNIPGQAPVPGDLVQSSEASYGGGLVAKKFQCEDTLRTFDINLKTGTCGTWVNGNETYPDTTDFDASAIGGPNLRNQPVQHHRMPSIRWCKENLYSNDSTYGKNKLDLLGIRVSNLSIPAQYQNQLDGGYEIYYAKRTINNSTIVAQSALLFGARHGSGAGTITITGPDTDYKTTGGNWHSQIDWEGNSRERPLVIDLSLFRFHAFDLLFNRPAIAPKFMRQEILLHRANMPMIEDYSLTGGERDAPISYLVDYIKDGSPPIKSEGGTIIRKINDTDNKPQYAPNNLVSGKWFNVMAETAYVGKLMGPDILDLGGDISYNNLWTGEKWERPDKAAQFETCYLSNLCNLPANIYLPFNGQPVVRMAPRQTGSPILFGGDVFLNDYTFNTYGWQDYVNGTYSKDSTRDPFMGIKVARRIACEATSNIYNRFEITGNIYSKWYPNSPLDIGDNNMYLNLFDRRIDPNQFGYDKDSNALNDIVTAQMFNPLQEDLRVFPFRIHRGGRLNRQLKTRSWRTFLPLDYYEMQKNMGVIEHLEGLDDRLLIHCTASLFYTRPKLNLEQGTLAVVIGNGDIFDFEPQETYADKLGYAGTQHNLACYRTPAGYISVDAEHGEVFLFKGELKLMTQGLSNFMRDHLKVNQNNPFTANGITIGYDQDYKRILLTCKNLILPTGVKTLVQTPEFINSLTPGESLVTDNGRLMRFLGVSTDYQCVDPVPVIVNDIEITIPEDTEVGATIYNIIAQSGVGLSYYIISGNDDNALFIGTATGHIKVANQAGINYTTRQQLIIQAKAISTNGLSDTFTITVHITDVNRPPVSGPQQFSIPENSPNGTLIGRIAATDPDNGSLNYTITAGDPQGVFLMNGTTGDITVANSTLLDFEHAPSYLLTVSISDGFNTISIPVTIIVINVNEPPPLNDDSITIYDTTATGTQVYQFSTQDPEGDPNLIFEIVNATTTGVFSIDSSTGAVSLVDNSYLNAGITPQYRLTVRVKDTSQQSDEGTLTINVLADPETLEFRPASPSCSGGCPDGYSPTADGLFCERFTTIPATPPSGGPPVAIATATNAAYSNFGAIVYQTGFQQDGTGTIQSWMQQDVWRNPSNNLINGPLNRCGVWGATPVPDNEPVGFSIPVILTSATDIYIGVAGDNKCKIAIDGIVLVDQDPTAIGNSLAGQLPQFVGQGIQLAFKFWHIYKFTLQAGTRYIGLEGVNFGGPAGFGAEIYKNTLTELQNAALDPAYVASPGTFPLNQNHYSNLDLVFSTRSTRGGTFSSGISAGYSCPVDYAMDGSVNPPTCKLVDRIASTTRIWGSIQVYNVRTNTVIATLSNTAGQTYQGLPVPFFSPVNNHIDCGGTVTAYYNSPKAASIAKNDCTDGVGSVVKYAVPGGTYRSLVSQDAADTAAQSDVDSNKQAYANTHGTCRT